MWFFVFALSIFLVMPLHFWSVEHRKLDERFGPEKGNRIGAALGIISGWGYFAFLFGIWLSPQDRFTIPIFENIIVVLPLAGLFVLMIPILHLILAVVFIIPGMWFGIKGVKDLGLEASEKHKSETVITEGSYSIVRHPQYLGALLAHIGISILLSALWALLFTPLLIIRDFVICRKEELEMEREFGPEYEVYKKQVPMLIPRFRKSDSSQENM